MGNSPNRADKRQVGFEAQPTKILASLGMSAIKIAALSIQ